MTENPVSVGVPCESVPGERRVALVPEIVRRIVATGVRVVVEPGAGAQAMISDAAFVAAGAGIDADAAWPADVVVKVSPPSTEEVGAGCAAGRC
jgi:H+-translocating NAD(P) transhydrogenase subunit alpha